MSIFQNTDEKKDNIWPQLWSTHRCDISFQTLQHNNKRSCFIIASLLDLWCAPILGRNTFLPVVDGKKNPNHSFRALHPSVCRSPSSSHPFYEECTPHQKKKKQKRRQHVERMYTLAEHALMCSAAPSSRSIMHGCVSVTSPGDTTRCRACGGKSKCSLTLARSLTLSLSTSAVFLFFFPLQVGWEAALSRRLRRGRREEERKKGGSDCLVCSRVHVCACTQHTHFICLTIVLFPDSPAPERERREELKEEKFINFQGLIVLELKSFKASGLQP